MNLGLAFHQHPSCSPVPPPELYRVGSEKCSQFTRACTRTPPPKNLITESLLPSTGAWSTDNAEGFWSKMANYLSTDSGAGKYESSVVLFFHIVLSTLQKPEMLGKFLPQNKKKIDKL